MSLSIVELFHLVFEHIVANTDDLIRNDRRAVDELHLRGPSTLSRRCSCGRRRHEEAAETAVEDYEQVPRPGVRQLRRKLSDPHRGACELGGLEESGAEV